MSKERDELQKRVRVLSKEYPYLALTFATRVGKTIAAIKVMEEHKGFWNIVVAERQHIQQWKDEIIKHGLGKHLDYKINIFCYQSLHKYLDSDVFWIFDEAHHMFTFLRWNMIASVRIPRALFLSPELSPIELQDIQYLFDPQRTKFKELKISLKTAINKGLLPEPTIYLIPLILNNQQITQAITIKTGDPKKREIFKRIPFKDRFKYLGKHKNLHLNILCTEQEKYDLISGELEYKKEVFKKHDKEWAKVALLRVGLKRKNFLSQIKTQYIREFLDTIQDKRFICFTNSIKQCESLNVRKGLKKLTSLDIPTIHSKQKISANDKILKAFNNKQINSLFVVNMLTEGTNLTDVDIGIIIQLDIIERRYIQKSGRIFLSECPKQFIFYYKDTKDESLVQTHIKDKIDKKYIREVSFEQLIKVRKHEKS